VYLGGHLEIGDFDWAAVEDKFKAMGVDRVYPPNVQVSTVVADLETDLA
jgi:methylaspartate mutase sigma subunit